ncbi:hypothetical protein ACTQ5K_07090 [Niallia sp. Sow4_A1]|nr:MULTISPECIES: hypothetical protein [unclassified Bacillus (in: firmicutes)]
MSVHFSEWLYKCSFLVEKGKERMKVSFSFTIIDRKDLVRMLMFTVF